MSLALITGSAGLIGSEAVRRFYAEGFSVVGIDNDLRGYFFGDSASTTWLTQVLAKEIPGYQNLALDIRNKETLERYFSDWGTELKVIVHCAAQPSHDWAAKDPITDFGVNALGTLNLLELTRSYCPEAVFIHCSTNKVYGDTPNHLPFIEKETRWELDEAHPYSEFGIDESMSIDNSLHSVFGASKVSADVLVQEYGRYFGLKTTCLRFGCLTGPNHSAAMLHGFLAYVVKMAKANQPYNVFGYLGKQVRDNLHAHDVAEAFIEIQKTPGSGEVFNLGGGRYSNCSVLEAIQYIESLLKVKMEVKILPQNRIGDHKWWISDNRKFIAAYPNWKVTYTSKQCIEEIVSNGKETTIIDTSSRLHSSSREKSVVAASKEKVLD